MSLLQYYSHSVDNANSSTLFFLSVGIAGVGVDVVVVVLVHDVVAVVVVVVVLLVLSFSLRQQEFLSCIRSVDTVVAVAVNVSAVAVVVIAAVAAAVGELTPKASPILLSPPRERRRGARPDKVACPRLYNNPKTCRRCP